jgi:hypothetical protein
MQGRPDKNHKRKEVDMADNIRIKVEPVAEPNLRKLARALIALAEQQLQAEEAAKTPPEPKGVAEERP